MEITNWIFYKKSAVAVIADRTAYGERYSYRPLSGIAVASINIYLFTVSNRSLLLMPINFSPFVAKRYIPQQKCAKK